VVAAILTYVYTISEGKYRHIKMYLKVARLNSFKHMARTSGIVTDAAVDSRFNKRQKLSSID
jgi:hypothetical protein